MSTVFVNRKQFPQNRLINALNPNFCEFVRVNMVKIRATFDPLFSSKLAFKTYFFGRLGGFRFQKISRERDLRRRSHVLKRFFSAKGRPITPALLPRRAGRSAIKQLVARTCKIVL